MGHQQRPELGNTRQGQDIGNIQDGPVVINTANCFPHVR